MVYWFNYGFGSNCLLAWGGEYLQLVESYAGCQPTFWDQCGSLSYQRRGSNQRCHDAREHCYAFNNGKRCGDRHAHYRSGCCGHDPTLAGFRFT